MRLDDEKTSKNIEDNRGRGGGGFRFPGGGGQRRIRMGGKKGGMGIGTIVILLIAMFVFGVNPLEFLNGGGGSVQAPQTRNAAPPSSAQQDAMKTFVSKVLHTTETTW